MAAPIWTTPPGTLGTIAEGQFYQLLMQATNPDDPTGADPESLTYKIVAGSLPPGLVMYENGSIQGNPKNNYYIRGVPFEVKQDVTNVFCCRATNAYTGQVTDRTFSLTVTGEDPPDLLTDRGELGRFLDGMKVNLQLEAIDLDSEPISWRISSGSLPPGLTLDSNTGLISGYIEPVVINELANKVGWSAESGWEEYPWDYNARAVSTSYQFSVQITDGKAYDGAQYSIFVYSHDAMTSDNTVVTADHDTVITADTDNKRHPVLLTEASDLGTYAHDNYFAYKFMAKDFDGDAVSFSLLLAENVGFENEISGFDSTLFDSGDFTLPPGLTLNTETGWLYGQIPRSVSGQTEYSFAVKVYKTDYPTYQSGLTYFTMTIINDLRRLVTWSTASNLGTLMAGGVSEKYVAATNAIDRTLLYTIVSGRLPQGLRMNQDGLIVGRASFEVSSFDKGLTTFDANVRELGALLGETTLDRKFTFRVKAADSNGELVSYRTFYITVDPADYDPYESLYLRAQPGLADKQTISLIFNNTDVIQNSDLYRTSDPYFGRARDVRLLLLSGINASTAAEYMTAMSTNHYRKSLGLGAYSWAQALNDDGSVAYEVVYIDVTDELGDRTKSAPLSINLNNKITYEDSSLIVYPNSLLNMRQVMRQELTLNVLEPLPRWMTSRQPDGRILGWVPAVVVAYVKPGAGEKTVFNLNRLTTYDIKTVSFDVDRYIWDNNLSKNYDAVTNSFTESQETTFDARLTLDSEPTAVVDFAVEVPFMEIDGRLSAFIDSQGGLDGITLPYVGKKIIFAQQQDYTDFDGEYDGWVRYGSLWDDVTGWDDGIIGYDEYEVIAGYESSLDGSTVNQRASIWLITEGDNGELRLEFDSEITLGDTVEVLNGSKFGGKVLRYGPLIYYGLNETVPRYRIYEDVEQGISTIFDQGATRFISNVSVYQEPDEGDKYLAFPKTNIWA